MINYLDFASTTPVDTDVSNLVVKLMVEEFGNASSKTICMERKQSVVSNARDQIARSLDIDPRFVFFTSGATESNNLAILGLAYSEYSFEKNILFPLQSNEAV